MRPLLFSEWSIGEVEDVDVDVHRDVVVGERGECVAGSRLRGGDHLLLCGDVQLQAEGVFAFEIGSLCGIDTEERDLAAPQERLIIERGRELGHRTGQVESVPESHPVQRTLHGGLGSVHVEVTVDVDQPARGAGVSLHAGDRAGGDGAVASDHQDASLTGDFGVHAVGEFPDGCDDVGCVLGERPLSIRSPHLQR